MVPSQKENGPKTFQIMKNTKNQKNKNKIKKMLKNHQISYDQNGWGHPYGWDCWMGLLDWIIGWFFFSQTLMGPAARRGIPRRGVFFLLFLRHIVQNGHKWSKNVISGPDFLKNDDSWSDLII